MRDHGELNQRNDGLGATPRLGGRVRARVRGVRTGYVAALAISLLGLGTAATAQGAASLTPVTDRAVAGMATDAAVTAQATACRTPAPRTAAGFQALFDRLEGGWAGGDGAESVPLPDGRTLWIFGDTIVGRSAESGGGYAPGVRMVRNSFVLQDRGCLHPVNGPGGREVLATRGDGSFYWPTAGIVDAGRLFLFASRMRVTGIDSFAFQQVGTDVAIIDVPRGGAPVVRVVRHVSPSDGTAVPSWGQALARSGGWLYVYGTRTDPRPYQFGKELYVARTRPGHLADMRAWRYFDGHRFVASARAARPVIRSDTGVSTTLSVLVDHRGRATLVSKQFGFLGTEVRAWTAPTPVGPFSLARPRLFAAPSDDRSGELLYLAEAHPQFRLAGGKTLVTISRNNRDLTKVMSDRLLYRPQFHAVTLPR